MQVTCICIRSIGILVHINNTMNISQYATPEGSLRLANIITKNRLWRDGVRQPDKNQYAIIRVPGSDVVVMVVNLTCGYCMITDPIEEVKQLLHERCYASGMSNSGPRPHSDSGYFHRHLLVKLGIDIPEDKEVDHIDRRPLNNTRANLRVVYSYENMRNKNRYKNNTSGRSGVIWRHRDKVWVIRCDVNKIRRQRTVNPRLLGISKEEAFELAVKAREELEIEMSYHI